MTVHRPVCLGSSWPEAPSGGSECGMRPCRSGCSTARQNEAGMAYVCVVSTLGSGGHDLENERRPFQAEAPSAGHSPLTHCRLREEKRSRVGLAAFVLP